MMFFRKMMWTILGLALVGSIVYGFFQYYSYIFAKEVQGEVIGVERIGDKAAVLGMATDTQFFSFAVAVRSQSGEIFTASTEDRQWAVVNKGQCVVAKFYPYPPWDLTKANTFFNARLVRLFDCPSK